MNLTVAAKITITKTKIPKLGNNSFLNLLWIEIKTIIS